MKISPNFKVTWGLIFGQGIDGLSLYIVWSCDIDLLAKFATLREGSKGIDPLSFGNFFIMQPQGGLDAKLCDISR